SDEARHGGGWSRESVSVLLLHEEFVEVDAGLETFLDVYLTCGVEDVSEVATVQVGFDRLDDEGFCGPEFSQHKVSCRSATPYLQLQGIDGSDSSAHPSDHAKSKVDIQVESVSVQDAAQLHQVDVLGISGTLQDGLIK